MQFLHTKFYKHFNPTSKMKRKHRVSQKGRLNNVYNKFEERERESVRDRQETLKYINIFGHEIVAHWHVWAAWHSGLQW